MKYLITVLLLTLTSTVNSQINPFLPDFNPPFSIDGYSLKWNDEFDNSGKPDEENWNYETGYVRNEENQWYKKENASCSGGLLLLTAKREVFKNSGFERGSNNWRLNREYVQYTSASVNTRGIHTWLYGRFEVRAKIPAVKGSWPAIWTLGSDQEWPLCGEIDIMEFYSNTILANAAWGTEVRFNAKWNSVKIPFSHFTEKDVEWANKFHIWRMDWSPDYIKIYLDNELLNSVDLSNTHNPNGTNPFHQPHYILLNLAIGGKNGGDPSNTKFPLVYAIDYVRIYQLEK